MYGLVVLLSRLVTVDFGHQGLFFEYGLLSVGAWAVFFVHLDLFWMSGRVFYVSGLVLPRAWTCVGKPNIT